MSYMSEVFWVYREDVTDWCQDLKDAIGSGNGNGDSRNGSTGNSGSDGSGSTGGSARLNRLDGTWLSVVFVICVFIVLWF